ncbi:unnamed protein product [Acanthoscelides obtectus]|uniref:AMP-dependent synthetase/ligase domain-containing protein n=1 Tax=Acanthoscelides obtectus TaxID=200917 RepID=A0A9P0Q300_ACAOB|nr:unnamed protein product [Acanthoscelides obtectus]CAK1621523.1 4-coumarate--CoA ligase 1 [Acanthoscelides obtectus]
MLRRATLCLVGKARRHFHKEFSNFRWLCSAANEQNILKSDVLELDIPRTSVHEYFYERIEKFYKYTAVECSETGRKYSYEEVRCKARNLSKYLIKKLKLQKGDVVAILSPNIPEYMITCLGILEAGLVITSMNPIYTADEVYKQLVDSSAKVLITLNDGAISKTAKTAVKMTKKQLPIIVIKDKMSLTPLRWSCDFKIKEDMSKFIPLKEQTTGQDLFCSFKNIISSEKIPI